MTKKKLTKKDIELKRAKRIYYNIKKRTNQPFSWYESDFISWYFNKENEGCYYCKTTIQDIHKFHELTKNTNKRSKQRGNNFEVDRIEDKEYSEENCVLSCYWCNNAKTDVFTEYEAKQIGNVIKDIIQNRIQHLKETK